MSEDPFHPQKLSLRQGKAQPMNKKHALRTIHGKERKGIYSIWVILIEIRGPKKGFFSNSSQEHVFQREDDKGLIIWSRYCDAYKLEVGKRYFLRKCSTIIDRPNKQGVMETLIRGVTIKEEE